MNNMVKVGDKVMWKGCFGMDPAQVATIESIQLCEQRRTKYGEEVDEAPWTQKDFLVVTLTNGSWAYGEQLSPIGGAK